MLAAWLLGTRSITRMRGSFWSKRNSQCEESDLGRDEGAAHTVDIGVVVSRGPRLGGAQTEHRL